MFLADDATQQAEPPIDADIARWSGEGGSISDAFQPDLTALPELPDPVLTNTELGQLRIRVIALENLVLALLAQAFEQPGTTAMQMAAHITPRPGCTPHRLTLHAAALMQHLGGRAREIRDQQRAVAVVRP